MILMSVPAELNVYDPRNAGNLPSNLPYPLPDEYEYMLQHLGLRT